MPSVPLILIIIDFECTCFQLCFLAKNVLPTLAQQVKATLNGIEANFASTFQPTREANVLLTVAIYVRDNFIQFDFYVGEDGTSFCIATSTYSG